MGSFFIARPNTGRRIGIMVPEIEEEVLQLPHRNVTTGTRAAATVLPSSHGTVGHVLLENVIL